MLFYFPTINSYYHMDQWVIDAWGWAAAASVIFHLVNMCFVFGGYNPFHDWVSGARLESPYGPVEPRGFEVIMNQKETTDKESQGQQ